MQLDWYKCKGGVWCDFFNLDLEHRYIRELEGVFLMWSGDKERSIVKVGQGNISDELLNLRKQLAIRAFVHLGLYCTWADVPSHRRDGVEVYLAKTLKPKISDSVPNATAVNVNLPWEE